MDVSSSPDLSALDQFRTEGLYWSLGLINRMITKIPCYNLWHTKLKHRDILHGVFVITRFISPRLQYRTEGLPEIRYWLRADRSGDDERPMLWSVYHIDSAKKRFTENSPSTFFESGGNLIPRLKTVGPNRESRKHKRGDTGGWLQYSIV